MVDLDDARCCGVELRDQVARTVHVRGQCYQRIALLCVPVSTLEKALRDSELFNKNRLSLNKNNPAYYEF
jgi:hypothetical protein